MTYVTNKPQPPRISPTGWSPRARGQARPSPLCLPPRACTAAPRLPRPRDRRLHGRRHQRRPTHRPDPVAAYLPLDLQAVLRVGDPAPADRRLADGTRRPGQAHPRRRETGIFTIGQVARARRCRLRTAASSRSSSDQGCAASRPATAAARVGLDRGRLRIPDGKGGKDSVFPLLPSALQAVADLDLMGSQPGGPSLGHPARWRRDRDAPLADGQRPSSAGTAAASPRPASMHEAAHDPAHLPRAAEAGRP